jgi:hypothetical protein
MWVCVIHDGARCLLTVVYQEWPEGPTDDEISVVPPLELPKRVGRRSDWKRIEATSCQRAAL